MSGNLRSAIKIFFWVSGLILPLGMAASRLIHFNFLNHYGYVWMGVLSIAFSFFLVQRVVVFLLPMHSRAITLVVLSLIALVCVYSLYNGLSQPKLRRVTLPMEGLPPSTAGFTIVQLSDLHLDDYKTTGALARIVDRVNALEPDIVVFTGDLFDNVSSRSEGFCAELRRLSAVHGVFAVTGNHEFFRGMDRFEDLAGRSGIRILRNEGVTVAGKLQLFGWDDDTAERFDSPRPPLSKVLASCRSDIPAVLLYHQPIHFEEAVSLGVDLQLSGHTHAGQIPPLDFLVWLLFKHPYGLFSKEGAFIYTTAGTGYWGPPMRLFTSAEIVHFTLEGVR
jgi:hypothetical protein